MGYGTVGFYLLRTMMTNKPFPSDLEIALAAELKPITEIAAERHQRRSFGALR